MRGGMPAGKSQLDRLRKRFDPLRERMDLLISGRAPSDPFYLTNRTWRQKLKIASLIAAPVLLLIAPVTIGATGRFRFHKVDPDERPPAEAPAPAEAPPPAAPPRGSASPKGAPKKAPPAEAPAPPKAPPPAPPQNPFPHPYLVSQGLG